MERIRRARAPQKAVTLMMLAASLALSPGRASTAPADAVIDPTVTPTPGVDPTDASSEGTSRQTGSAITPIFAPIPFKNSQLGWGLALMVGAIHRFEPDTTIKPSTGAIAGFYTENKSWGLMALEMARLAHDTWRLRGLASHVDVRYDFYGIGEDAGNTGASIALEQPMDFVVASVLRRMTPGLYGGATLLWIRSSVELQDNHGLALPPPSQDLSTTNLLAPGVQAEFDTRDDDYWPRRGSLASAKANFFAAGLGSSREFQRYAIAWSWYTRLPAPALVLATNLNAAASMGDVPFWAIPSVGGGAYGLRGYTQGRYRDKLVTTAQAELRAHAKNRWGATAFGGLAQVAPSAGQLRAAEVLPAGGVGLRFQLTRQYPMHMRADYAWGKNGGIFYFSVNEAF
jgi:hypothetical protein